MEIVHIRATAPRSAALLIIVFGVAVLAARAVDAQELPSGPISIAGGRVMVGADVSFSTSTEKDDATQPAESGWFNYTDYEHSTMRLARMGVTADVRVADWVSFL